MKVCEGPDDLQNLIFEFFEIERNDPEEERFILISENLLRNVRFELLHSYHYESDEDKKKIQTIIQKIDACGT